jgi:hypothetical protein
MLDMLEFPETLDYRSDGVLNEPLSTKLNKLKKSNIEAYFYWNEIDKQILIM